MNESDATRQIVQTLQEADTVLVTVGTDPSVDTLSAALGLTAYLNDMGKHATAVVSGAIPPAINFLEPEKTFEPTVDSLRDFVIALDKEKADHLRYKVEGDVVKIFITPYKTVITSHDLDFTQGDYNVEAVVALGVNDQDHLDKALAAHGKIFHDASVMTISLDDSTLGTTNWVDNSASSISELTASLVDFLKTEEHPVSAQVSGALLTGIVSATDRFSNDKTSARTMALASELMAAGANQQLIATKLREGAKLPLEDDGKSTKIDKKKKTKQPETPAPTEAPKPRDGGLDISHNTSSDNEVKDDKKQSDDTESSDTPEEVADATATLEEALKKSEQVNVEPETPEPAPEETPAPETVAPETPAPETAAPETAAPEAPKTAEDELSAQLASITPEVPTAPELTQAKSSLDTQNDSYEPSFGGTLNATTEQAAQDKRNNDKERNQAILTHGGGQYVGDQTPMFESKLNSGGKDEEPAPSVDPFAEAAVTAQAAPIQPAAPTGTLAEIDQQNRGASDGPQMTIPAPQPPAVESGDTPPPPPMPPMPDFSMLPPLPPEANGMPQPPALETMPLPPEQLGSTLPDAPAETPAPDTSSNDPGQFKIPSQQ